MNLPAACPSRGSGSTLSPIYTATTEAVFCWVCGEILPVVAEAQSKVRAADPAQYAWLDEKKLALHPSDIKVYSYRVILVAALADDLGLCPDCHEDLSRACPSAIEDVPCCP